MSTALRVAVDGTSLLGPRTGVGHVTAGLIGALAPRPDLDLVVYAVTWRGRRELASTLPDGVTAASAPIPARLTRALWLRIDVPRVERWTGPVDVAHGTCFVGPPARVPVIVTVHDLTFARFPEMCTADTLQYGRLIRRALDRGATIHAVSDFVAAEVRDEFGLTADRVVRVYGGLTPAAGGDTARGRRRAGADRYVLALGTIEPRKNLPTLVRAFDAIAARDDDLRLVVGGPDGWGAEEFDAACAAARHADRIRRLGYLADQDRADVLAGAAAFAYPSYYEGFGHPPLEAMAAGVPVVAARAGALPETLGGAALLVEPSDVEGLADALSQVLDDGALRADLVARGSRRVPQFSWERAAGQFAELYQAAA